MAISATNWCRTAAMTSSEASARVAYQGRYTISGNHIDYVDDTGFTADGDFVDGVLHHAE